MTDIESVYFLNAGNKGDHPQCLENRAEADPVGGVSTTGNTIESEKRSKEALTGAMKT